MSENGFRFRRILRFNGKIIKKRVYMNVLDHEPRFLLVI